MSDTSVLADLSDQTIETNSDAISEVCNNWKKTVVGIDINSQNIETVFQPLTSVGVASYYVPSLKNALEKVENMILSASNYVQNAAQEQAEIDEISSNKDKKYNTATNNGKRRSSSNDFNNNSNSTAATYTTATDTSSIIVENPTVTETSVDDSQIQVDINTIVSKINAMTYDSYIKFMTALGSITGGKLTEYITNEKYATELKKLLLESPEISDDFKAQIKDMDAVTVQALLKNILVNIDGVSDLSKIVINKYTESENGKTELIAATKGNGFYEDVDVIYNEFSSILSKDAKLTNSLQDIYDGANPDVSDKTMDFVRIVIDELASSKNMTYNELLSESNESMLRTEMESLSKSLAYFRTVNTLDSETASRIYQVVIGR